MSRTHRALLATLAVGSMCGCGARTSLDRGDALAGEGGTGDVGGGSSASSTSTAGVTSSSASSSASIASVSSSASTGGSCLGPADCDDFVDCTVDVCNMGVCGNVPDHGACADGVVCTLDTCVGGVGCENVLSDAACADGIACTIDSCDFGRDECVYSVCDSVCDDNDFCNGVERCDTTFGCTSGAPACELGLGCDVSECFAPATCSHDLPPGCAAPDLHLLVTDSAGALWDVAPYASQTTLVAPSGSELHLDIAILAGRWFAISGNLVELVPGTNQVLKDLGFGAPAANSLGVGPDAKLYAAGAQVHRLDPDTGAAELLGTLPPGHSSSGDIAFLADRMFVSTDSSCGGNLVEFDVDTGAGTVLGGDGLGCVYGLAAFGSVLVLVNCDGKIGTFDPNTGEAQVFATTQVTVYGADIL